MLQEQAKTVSVIPEGEIQSHSRYVFVRVMFIIGLVLLVLSLAAGGHSGDLMGPARWGITHV
jgi:ABC-type phosphate transport system permease subunit